MPFDTNFPSSAVYKKPTYKKPTRKDAIKARFAGPVAAGILIALALCLTLGVWFWVVPMILGIVFGFTYIKALAIVVLAFLIVGLIKS